MFCIFSKFEHQSSCQNWKIQEPLWTFWKHNFKMLGSHWKKYTSPRSQLVFLPEYKNQTFFQSLWITLYNNQHLTLYRRSIFKMRLQWCLAGQDRYLIVTSVSTSPLSIVYRGEAWQSWQDRVWSLFSTTRGQDRCYEELHWEDQEQYCSCACS